MIKILVVEDEQRVAELLGRGLAESGYEVKLAYDREMDLIYHDANKIDLIKETPELIQEIRRAKEYFFYQDRNQAVEQAYQNGEKEYVITTINVDRYGYAKMIYIRNLLIIIFVVAILILLAIGYALARAALRPFSNMIHKVETLKCAHRRSLVRRPETASAWHWRRR